MDFKVGSLMNLISGNSDSKGSAQKIVFKQKPRDAPTKQPVAKKANGTVRNKKSFSHQNDQKSLVKSSSLKSTLNFQGKFKRGTLNKSLKNLNVTWDSKPEIAENSSKSVVGKSFRHIKSDNIPNTGDDATDGTANDDKLERTIFVGNLPLTNISDSAIKKLFAKFGGIESFRLRSVPVKDPRVSKKVTAIKKEFHPDRTSTNAYVVMRSKAAADAALSLNGTLLDDHHLRIDKASASEEHDPRKAIFLGNVSFKAEEDDIWNLFEECGEIDHIRLLRDKKTMVSRGGAYVNFKSADSVELALEMQGTAEIHGRIVQIRRYLPGRTKSAVSSRQPASRNTDETKDDKARLKDEKRFLKKMKRRTKRDEVNAANEALGVRSRPLKDPATAKSFIGVKAQGEQQKKKKKKLNKGEVQRKKVAKILGNVKSEIVKSKNQSQLVDIGDLSSSRGQEISATQDSAKKMKKKPKVAGKVTKKTAPKTILIKQNGEIKKKKLKKLKI